MGLPHWMPGRGPGLPDPPNEGAGGWGVGRRGGGLAAWIGGVKGRRGLEGAEPLIFPVLLVFPKWKIQENLHPVQGGRWYITEHPSLNFYRILRTTTGLTLLALLGGLTEEEALWQAPCGTAS